MRVSTDEQASSGLGLEAQRAAIAGAALRLKLELVRVEADEGVSGAIDPHKRPALARALALLEEGDTLLVAKRDRLGRDVLQLVALEHELAKRGVRIVSAAGEGTEDDGPYSRFMRRILDAVAELERSMIRERTRKSLRAARARGQRAGAVPFGFRALEDGRLEEDLDETATLAMMKVMRSEGLGYKGIAKALELAGKKTKRGAPWSPSSVKSILGSAER